ncbi:hypothetical protein [Anaeroselena agilis]|uniref:Uncharacterized protein n=1 Tax=Anaeroselena agilis TaxID=3063788 RepID=A0ABU3P2E2_9FIRM|nr:hypothetical protein [Selenomonadales bacterium 4137-cl]
MMGYGYGYPGMFGFMSGFGIVFALLHIAIIVYILWRFTQISHSLQRIAASLEKMGRAPDKNAQ